MGIDEQSKGVCIYWPDMRTVGVKRNVYVDKTGASASHLKGEDWDGFGETIADAPFISQNPSNTSTITPGNPDVTNKPGPDDLIPIEPALHDVPSHEDEIPSEPDLRPKCTRKPTECVHDLISGKAIADYQPKLG